MIYGISPLNTSGSILGPLEYDPYQSLGSIGAISFRRPKRSGRNPATGARNSRRYGISNIFLTGFPPMQDSQGNPII